MPRDLFTFTALQHLSEVVRRIEDPRFFELSSKSMTTGAIPLPFGDGSTIALTKDGCTSSGAYANIIYHIHVQAPAGSQRFKVYVMGPSRAAVVNHRAVLGGIRYFMNSDVGIYTHDEEAWRYAGP